MPVVYSLAAKNARLSAVQTLIDAGSGNGVIRLLDSNSLVLSTLPLAKPCATVSGGVMTFGGLPLTDPSAALSGTAVAARIEDSAGTQIITGLTVSAGGGTDVLLTPTAAITAGQSVAIQTATITGN